MDYVDALHVEMSSKAVTPTRATEHSVGLDLYSPSDKYRHKLGLKFL